MVEWLRSWLGHVFLGLLALDHAIDRLIPLWKKVHNAEEIIERRIGDRRHHMSIGNWIQDAEALIALEPLLIKFIEDARSAAPVLEADAIDLKNKLMEIFHPAPAAPPPTPATPPTGAA